MGKQGITVEEFQRLCPDAQFVTDKEFQRINKKIARGKLVRFGPPDEPYDKSQMEKIPVTREMIDAALKRHRMR